MPGPWVKRTEKVFIFTCQHDKEYFNSTIQQGNSVPSVPMINIKLQTDPIWGIIANPKKTLEELPSDHFYIAALVIPVFLIFPRLLPFTVPENLPVAKEMVGIVPLMVWIAIFFFISSFVVKTVAEVFGRRMTFKKAMNMVGYCQAPRVLFIVAVSIVDFLIPALRESTDLARTLNLMAVILAIYSFGLMVYGIKIFPKKRKK